MAGFLRSMEMTKGIQVVGQNRKPLIFNLIWLFWPERPFPTRDEFSRIFPTNLARGCRF